MGHDHDLGGGPLARVSADADRDKLAIALRLIVGFTAFEVAVGVLAHSLALLSDAALMLTDAGAIGLALVPIRRSSRCVERSHVVAATTCERDATDRAAVPTAAAVSRRRSARRAGCVPAAFELAHDRRTAAPRAR